VALVAGQPFPALLLPLLLQLLQLVVLPPISVVTHRARFVPDKAGGLKWPRRLAVVASAETEIGSADFGRVGTVAMKSSSPVAAPQISVQQR
jgi:hypothetical protein